MDSKEKFSHKSEIYDKFRPRYASQLIEYLGKEYIVSKDFKIADIGAGTGILTQQLVSLGCSIVAVEPNREMREIAEEKLKQSRNCKILDGSAESIPVENQSIDLVVVAQAFHWFDTVTFKQEFDRITKTGKAMLIWNSKDKSQAYLKELEMINRQYCREFKGFSGGFREDSISEFFDGYFRKLEFPNLLKLNEEQFIQGTLSASYAPVEGDTHYSDYLQKIKRLFDQFSRAGEIEIMNSTIAYHN